MKRRHLKRCQKRRTDPTGRYVRLWFNNFRCLDICVPIGGPLSGKSVQLAILRNSASSARAVISPGGRSF
jgi:hypothetical protein